MDKSRITKKQKTQPVKVHSQIQIPYHIRTYSVTSDPKTLCGMFKQVYDAIMNDFVSSKYDNPYTRISLLQTGKVFVVNIVDSDTIKSGLFGIIKDSILKDMNETKNMIHSMESFAKSINTTPENTEFQISVEQYVPFSQLSKDHIDQMKLNIQTVTGRRVFIAYKLFTLGYMVQSTDIVEQSMLRPYLDIISS